MYYLLQWPKFLTDNINNEAVQDLVTSSNEEYIAIFTNRDVIFYHHKSLVKILSYSRSQESLDHYGESVTLVWKNDCTFIAIGTSGGFVLIFHLQADQSKKRKSTLLNRKDDGVYHSWHGKQGIPSFSIQLVDVMDFQQTILCMCSVYEDILVSTKDGNIHRVTWSGGILYNQRIQLAQIPFYYDLEQSRGRIAENGTYCRTMEWCSSMGGLLMLLSTGRAALLNIPSNKLDPGQVEGVWAEHLKHGTCMAANLRFRLVAFGGKAGDGVVYTRDDATGALKILHRLRISTREYPDAANAVGSVLKLRWSPDNYVLAMVWERAGFCLWSVFGTLLFSTLGEKMSLGTRMHLKSAEWGPEGYDLWSVGHYSSSPTTSLFERQNSSQSQENDKCHTDRIIIFGFCKSSLTRNPSVYNHEHLLLQSSSTLYINERSELNDAKHWHVVNIPAIYLTANWPIKYAAIDATGKNIAIAGKNGLAFYFMNTKKWKVFGNETQEKDMEVLCSMAWWRDFICVGCFNRVDSREELRIYPSLMKLDNTFSNTVKLSAAPRVMNLFRNTLILLTAESHISLYSLQLTSPSKSHSVTLSHIQEVDISSFIHFPFCVSAITLTSLRSEISVIRQTPTCEDSGSLLLSYAGRLFMFQRDLSSLQDYFLDYPYQYNHSGTPSGPYYTSSYYQNQYQSIQEDAVDEEDDSNSNNFKPLPFMAPFIVASSVEILWITCRDSPDKKYLTDSLWLNCGSQGMRVWLPLLSRDARTPGFMSKRIMLPFEVDVYPLVILFEEALLIGASNEFSLLLQHSQESTSAAADHHTLPYAKMPYALVEKSSQIYLHHIVKQLLRKNLGVHALELSLCCRALPYFHHVLELLLHEVLEKEATSKEPIPDPLLPRVVAFIQEFPEFLDTVAHCARKTEVALWPYLFSTVGNPRDLFESCLRNGDLAIASSYLIILQNTEKAIYSRYHAISLLEAALNKCEWSLVNDLMRFLKTIDPKELSDSGTPNSSTSPSGMLPFSPTNVTHASSGPPSSLGKHHRNLLQKRSSSRQIIPNSSGSNHVSHSAGNASTGPTPAPPQPSNQNSTTGGRRRNNSSLSYDEPVMIDTGVANLSAAGRHHHHSQPGGSGAVAQQNLQSVGGQRSGSPPAMTTGKSKHGPASAGSPSSHSGPSPNSVTFSDEVESLLSRYAKKLLTSYKLMDLAKFAANTHFHDRQFIAWLFKERHKSAQIQDYVQALQQLHNDFRWPLPLFIPRVPPPGSSSDPENYSQREQNVGSLVLPLLTVDNLAKQQLHATKDLPVTASLYSEVLLKPATRTLPGGARPMSLSCPPATNVISQNSLDTPTTPVTYPNSSQCNSSEMSALPGTDVTIKSGPSSVTSGSGNGAHNLPANIMTPDELVYLQELEIMTQEFANKGPQESETQLRYLYQLFLEARCYEWCILISVLLRDPVGIVYMTSSPATSNSSTPVTDETNQPKSNFKMKNHVDELAIEEFDASRIQRGLMKLEEWSETACLGYKGFLMAVKPHLNALLFSLSRIEQADLFGSENLSLNENESDLCKRRKNRAFSQPVAATRPLSLDENSLNSLSVNRDNFKKGPHEEPGTSRLDHQSTKISSAGRTVPLSNHVHYEEDEDDTEKGYFKSMQKLHTTHYNGANSEKRQCAKSSDKLLSPNLDGDSDSILSQSLEHMELSSSCLSDSKASSNLVKQASLPSNSEGTKFNKEQILVQYKDRYRLIQEAKKTNLTTVSSSLGDDLVSPEVDLDHESDHQSNSCLIS